MKNKIFTSVITLILAVLSLGIIGCGNSKEYTCEDPQLVYDYSGKITLILLYEEEDIKAMAEDTETEMETKKELLALNKKDSEKVSKISSDTIKLVYKDNLTDKENEMIYEYYLELYNMVAADEVEELLELKRISKYIE